MHMRGMSESGGFERCAGHLTRVSRTLWMHAAFPVKWRETSADSVSDIMTISRSFERQPIQTTRGPLQRIDAPLQ
jgi:hypothetical protein